MSDSSRRRRGQESPPDLADSPEPKHSRKKKRKGKNSSFNSAMDFDLASVPLPPMPGEKVVFIPHLMLNKPASPLPVPPPTIPTNIRSAGLLSLPLPTILKDVPSIDSDQPTPVKSQTSSIDIFSEETDKPSTPAPPLSSISTSSLSASSSASSVPGFALGRNIDTFKLTPRVGPGQLKAQKAKISFQIKTTKRLSIFSNDDDEEGADAEETTADLPTKKLDLKLNEVDPSAKAKQAMQSLLKKLDQKDPNKLTDSDNSCTESSTEHLTAKSASTVVIQQEAKSDLKKTRPSRWGDSSTALSSITSVESAPDLKTSQLLSPVSSISVPTLKSSYSMDKIDMEKENTDKHSKKADYSKQKRSAQLSDSEDHSPESSRHSTRSRYRDHRGKDYRPNISRDRSLDRSKDSRVHRRRKQSKEHERGNSSRERSKDSVEDRKQNRDSVGKSQRKSRSRSKDSRENLCREQSKEPAEGLHYKRSTARNRSKQSHRIERLKSSDESGSEEDHRKSCKSTQNRPRNLSLEKQSSDSPSEERKPRHQKSRSSSVELSERKPSTQTKVDHVERRRFSKYSDDEQIKVTTPSHELSKYDGKRSTPQKNLRRDSVNDNKAGQQILSNKSQPEKTIVELHKNTSQVKLRSKWDSDYESSDVEEQKPGKNQEKYESEVLQKQSLERKPRISLDKEREDNDASSSDKRSECHKYDPHSKQDGGESITDDKDQMDSSSETETPKKYKSPLKLNLKRNPSFDKEPYKTSPKRGSRRESSSSESNSSDEEKATHKKSPETIHSKQKDSLRKSPVRDKYNLQSSHQQSDDRQTFEKNSRFKEEFSPNFTARRETLKDNVEYVRREHSSKSRLFYEPDEVELTDERGREHHGKLQRQAENERNSKCARDIQKQEDERSLSCTESDRRATRAHDAEIKLRRPSDQRERCLVTNDEDDLEHNLERRRRERSGREKIDLDVRRDRDIIPPEERTNPGSERDEKEHVVGRVIEKGDNLEERYGTEMFGLKDRLEKHREKDVFDEKIKRQRTFLERERIDYERESRNYIDSRESSSERVKREKDDDQSYKFSGRSLNDKQLYWKSGYTGKADMSSSQSFDSQGYKDSGRFESADYYRESSEMYGERKAIPRSLPSDDGRPYESLEYYTDQKQSYKQYPKSNSITPPRRQSRDSRDMDDEKYIGAREMQRKSISLERAMASRIARSREDFLGIRVRTDSDEVRMSRYSKQRRRSSEEPIQVKQRCEPRFYEDTYEPEDNYRQQRTSIDRLRVDDELSQSYCASGNRSRRDFTYAVSPRQSQDLKDNRYHSGNRLISNDCIVKERQFNSYGSVGPQLPNEKKDSTQDIEDLRYSEYSDQKMHYSPPSRDLIDTRDRSYEKDHKFGETYYSRRDESMRAQEAATKERDMRYTNDYQSEPEESSTRYMKNTSDNYFHRDDRSSHSNEKTVEQNFQTSQYYSKLSSENQMLSRKKQEPHVQRLGDQEDTKCKDNKYSSTNKYDFENTQNHIYRSATLTERRENFSESSHRNGDLVYPGASSRQSNSDKGSEIPKKECSEELTKLNIKADPLKKIVEEIGSSSPADSPDSSNSRKKLGKKKSRWSSLDLSEADPSSPNVQAADLSKLSTDQIMSPLAASTSILNVSNVSTPPGPVKAPHSVPPPSPVPPPSVPVIAPQSVPPPSPVPPPSAPVIAPQSVPPPSPVPPPLVPVPLPSFSATSPLFKSLSQNTIGTSFTLPDKLPSPLTLIGISDSCRTIPSTNDNKVRSNVKADYLKQVEGVLKVEHKPGSSQATQSRSCSDLTPLNPVLVPVIKSYSTSVAGAHIAPPSTFAPTAVAHNAHNSLNPTPVNVQTLVPSVHNPVTFNTTCFPVVHIPTANLPRTSSVIYNAATVSTSSMPHTSVLPHASFIGQHSLPKTNQAAIPELPLIPLPSVVGQLDIPLPKSTPIPKAVNSPSQPITSGKVSFSFMRSSQKNLSNEQTPGASKSNTMNFRSTIDAGLSMNIQPHFNAQLTYPSTHPKFDPLGSIQASADANKGSVAASISSTSLATVPVHRVSSIPIPAQDYTKQSTSYINPPQNISIVGLFQSSVLQNVTMPRSSDSRPLQTFAPKSNDAQQPSMMSGPVSSQLAKHQKQLLVIDRNAVERVPSYTERSCPSSYGNIQPSSQTENFSSVLQSSSQVSSTNDFDTRQGQGEIPMSLPTAVMSTVSTITTSVKDLIKVIPNQLISAGNVSDNAPAGNEKGIFPPKKRGFFGLPDKIGFSSMTNCDAESGNQVIQSKPVENSDFEMVTHPVITQTEKESQSQNSSQWKPVGLTGIAPVSDSIEIDTKDEAANSMGQPSSEQPENESKSDNEQTSRRRSGRIRSLEEKKEKEKVGDPVTKESPAKTKREREREERARKREREDRERRGRRRYEDDSRSDDDRRGSDSEDRRRYSTRHRREFDDDRGRDRDRSRESRGRNRRQDSEERINPTNDEVESKKEAVDIVSFATPSLPDGSPRLPTRPHLSDFKRDESCYQSPGKLKSRWRRTSEAEGLAPVCSSTPPPLDPTSSGNPQEEAACPPPPPPPPPPPSAPLEQHTVDPGEKHVNVAESTVAESVSDTPEVAEKAIQEAPEAPTSTETTPALSTLMEPSSSVTVEGAMEDTPQNEPQSEPEPSEEDCPYFERLVDNLYVGEKKRSKQMREVKRMICDCTSSSEDREQGLAACGEDCLNRMLMIECGNRCPCGEHCTNKRFQRHQHLNAKPVKTESKGWGLFAGSDFEPNQFVMEYIGEVLDYREFKNRTKQYAKTMQAHYYFMALNADKIIDATLKGNISRFINHSCDPNCETQKWTVNGELRVGFFTREFIREGEELTFDYQFENYGKEAQKCYCGSQNCRGFLGGNKSTPLKSRKKIAAEKKKKERFDDQMLEEEIEEMNTEDGMKNKDHVLKLCRLMVRAESDEHRSAVLNILQSTKEQGCLRLFLDYHGLPLLWSWMADISSTESRGLKLQILQTLFSLPISNKTVLKESKILAVVERWSQEFVTVEKQAESEPVIDSSSRLATPLTSILSGEESKLVKKRVKFADETSSDSEMSESSRVSSSQGNAESALKPSGILKYSSTAFMSGEKKSVDSSINNPESFVKQEVDDSVTVPPSAGSENVEVLNVVSTFKADSSTETVDSEICVVSKADSAASGELTVSEKKTTYSGNKLLSKKAGSDSQSESVSSKFDIQSEPVSSKSDIQSEPVTSKSDSQSEPVSSKSDSQSEPVSSKSDSQSESVSSKSDSQSEPVCSKSDSQSEPVSSKSDSQSEPVSNKSDSQSEPISCKSDSQSEPVSSKIKNQSDDKTCDVSNQLESGKLDTESLLETNDNQSESKTTDSAPDLKNVNQSDSVKDKSEDMKEIDPSDQSQSVTDKGDDKTEANKDGISEKSNESSEDIVSSEKSEIILTENIETMQTDQTSKSKVPCTESDQSVTSMAETEPVSQSGTVSDDGKVYLEVIPENSNSVQVKNSETEVEKTDSTELNPDRLKKEDLESTTTALKLPENEIASLASSLLQRWGELNELFRIPKKEQVEERKRTERELDRYRDRDYDRDRYDRKRRHYSPDKGHYKSSRYRSKRRDDPQTPDRLRGDKKRTLLPTPPKLSKEERRQLFEAQVKAKEEMAELQRQQQVFLPQPTPSVEADQTYSMESYYPDSNYASAIQDPNFLAALQHDPNFAEAVRKDQGFMTALVSDPNYATLIQSHPSLAALVQSNPTYAVQTLQQDPSYAAQLAQDPNYAAQLAQDPNYAAQLAQDSNYSAQLAQDPNYAAQLAQDPNYTARLAQDPNYAAHVAQDPNYAVHVAQDLNYAPALQRDPNYVAQLAQDPNYSTVRHDPAYVTRLAQDQNYAALGHDSNYASVIQTDPNYAVVDPTYAAADASYAGPVQHDQNYRLGAHDPNFVSSTVTNMNLHSLISGVHAAVDTVNPVIVDSQVSRLTAPSVLPVGANPALHVGPTQVSQSVVQGAANLVYQTPASSYQTQTTYIAADSSSAQNTTTSSYIPTQSPYVAGQTVQQVYYTPSNPGVMVQHGYPSQTQPTSTGQVLQVQHLPPQAAQVHQPTATPVTGEDVPPPPSPPRPKAIKLPPNWKTAKDSEGKVYYYHSVTKQTQWEAPTWDTAEQDDMDLGTPTHDEPSSKSKKKTTMAQADTSSEIAKRSKESFRNKMSKFIVTYLNPFRKPDCSTGRITSSEDFKHLARRLTHHVMAKELKHCRHPEDLEVNENVKAKAKDFVRKYMSKFGSHYIKSQSPQYFD